MRPVRRRHLPSLGALATFEVAAKHLSFTLAAKELNITQGAVSQQIRLLEKALEIELFVRRHNALDLTPAGIDLFAAVAAGLDTISAGVGLLQPQGQPETVTISATNGMASFWLKPLIDSLLGGMVPRTGRPVGPGPVKPDQQQGRPADRRLPGRRRRHAGLAAHGSCRS